MAGGQVRGGRIGGGGCHVVQGGRVVAQASTPGGDSVLLLRQAEDVAHGERGGTGTAVAAVARVHGGGRSGIYSPCLTSVVISLQRSGKHNKSSKVDLMSGKKMSFYPNIPFLLALDSSFHPCF